MFDVFFPNKSIAGIFWATLLLFLLPLILKKKGQFLFILLLIIALLLSYLLLTSDSRSGWFGFAVALVCIALIHTRTRKQKIILLAAFFFLFLLFLLLLFYKADSSSGRKHIYSISIAMWKANWLHGIGLGKFKAQFNEYQADYFSQNSIDDKRALLADNTFYAFNDYLQWIIETGMFGFIILVIVLYFIFCRARLLLKEYAHKPILLSSIASLICIAVASLFSYPLQVLPIQLFTLICTGVILFLPLKATVQSKSLKILTVGLKMFFVLLGTYFINHSIFFVKNKIVEKEAFGLLRAGYKTKAIVKYKYLSNSYPIGGQNIYMYAEQLYYSNRLTEALAAINKAKAYYVDSRVYALQAKIENELGKNREAEKCYLRAVYMVPNRMGSRFDLMNFYFSQGDTVKAVQWANSILKMPVKVPSERTKYMQQRTSSILEKIKTTI